MKGGMLALLGMIGVLLVSSAPGALANAEESNPECIYANVTDRPLAFDLSGNIDVIRPGAAGEVYFNIPTPVPGTAPGDFVWLEGVIQCRIHQVSELVTCALAAATRAAIEECV